MSPSTAKSEYERFLVTLLRSSSEQSGYQGWQLKILIQNLINGQLSPEVFVAKLRSEIKMATEPNLLSFLEMTLPHLQAALYSGETCIAEVSSPLVFSPTIQMRQLAIPAKEKVLLVSIGSFSLKLFCFCTI